VRWNLDPPIGFRGLQRDKTLTIYQRHLPHWRQAGATYFVTYRLADSLPQSKCEQLKRFRKDWEQRNPPPRSQQQLDELWREVFRRVDGWLDTGSGSCHLRSVMPRRVVANAFHHFDGERYELGCYVVMPNHVHLVVRPFDEDDDALTRVTHSWKRHSSLAINRLLGRDGQLWQDECFDRIIRDEENLWRVVQYIGSNPRKAGLNENAYSLWISESWKAAGWLFQDGDGGCARTS